MKIKGERDKAVNSSQVNKERTFHVHMLVERLCILRKIHFTIVFPSQACSYLFLILHQISGSCAFENSVQFIGK